MNMNSNSNNNLSIKQTLIQILKFTLFSASAGIIQVIAFTLFNEIAHLPYWPCYLIALTLSVLYNFTLNRHFTFKSATNIPKAMAQIGMYYLVFTPLSTWWGNALTNMGWNEYLILAGTMIINLATEYLVCRYVVYKDSMNTNIKTIERKIALLRE